MSEQSAPDSSPPASAVMRFTVLGCGGSRGVPNIRGKWGNCDPNNEKNCRTRSSLLIELVSGEEKTILLVDAGPDVKAQIAKAGYFVPDAVVLTHGHTDHIHGLHELGPFRDGRETPVPVYGDHATLAEAKGRWNFLFASTDKPKAPLEGREISPNKKVVIGEGNCAINITPVEVTHGAMKALGFVFEHAGQRVAYIPDSNEIPDASKALLRGLDVLIIGALNSEGTKDHMSLKQAIDYAEELAPKNLIITHMGINLDYDATAQRLAQEGENAWPAHDGMSFEMEPTGMKFVDGRGPDMSVEIAS